MRTHYDAPCQVYREPIGEHFSCRIVRDGLTVEGAKLVESVLTDLYRPQFNHTGGMSRQERPPLVMAA